MEKRLTEVLGQLDGGTYVDASKLTLGQWLTEWLKAVASRLRPNTHTRYSGIITQSLQPSALGAMLLQKIWPTHVEQYYAAATEQGTSPKVPSHCTT